MRNLDLESLWRSTVGFDRLFDLIDESARWTGEESNYPPYNIERTGEDHYQISLALAGFTPEEVSITAEQNVLTIRAVVMRAPRRRLKLSSTDFDAPVRPMITLFTIVTLVVFHVAPSCGREVERGSWYTPICD